MSVSLSALPCNRLHATLYRLATERKPQEPHITLIRRHAVHSFLRYNVYQWALNRLSSTVFWLTCQRVQTGPRPLITECEFWNGMTKWRRRIHDILLEWLVPLLRILEVPSSNVISDTGYPDKRYLWVFSVPPGNSCDTILTRRQSLPSTQFLLTIH
jgi:hypothetical protein